jgi:hypothetical protein
MLAIFSELFSPREYYINHIFRPLSIRFELVFDSVAFAATAQEDIIVHLQTMGYLGLSRPISLV